MPSVRAIWIVWENRLHHRVRKPIMPCLGSQVGDSSEENGKDSETVSSTDVYSNKKHGSACSPYDQKTVCGGAIRKQGKVFL